MTQKPMTIEQFRELISNGEAKDPLVFLESIMNGQDPRKISKLWEMIEEINTFSDGAPSKEDWAEVIEYVDSHMRYCHVSLSESSHSAKVLAEYIYPKRKQVDLNTSEMGKGGIQGDPLTEEEIELFKERFNDEF